MSETANVETTSAEEKPVQTNDEVKFPPFPDPTDDDFEDDISQEERNFYKNKFPDINAIKALRLHCTACDRHLGCSARNEARMRSHPMLRTLMCHTCHTFYNSGEFEKGDDGSELYCRWCGQGGQVYCCSDCPHVFCAKCIKRNLGGTKIKEIENTDDWKCFKCNSTCLWDVRAVCWALLRYCDLKNKIAYSTQDPILKEAYQKDCALDHTECCKNKVNKRREKQESKKKDAEVSIKLESKKKDADNATKKAISKIPPSIQVKKFASINLDETIKQEKKTQKRPASPRMKSVFLKSPMSIVPATKIMNPIPVPPLAKKMKIPNSPMINPIRFQKDRNTTATYTRIRPKPQMPILLNSQFNGFGNSGLYNNQAFNDNINLSLESLTQGLDMAAVAAMSKNAHAHDSDVVCTPDFPLEPLCEVTEDYTDDDVQCITPGPIAVPKVNTPPPPPPPPPLVPRLGTSLHDLSSENIIQMTENDVTVNASTGGLKFRVDPQTLSSNKMYRLPDGRIFAINANPNMPGGYSATIVAVTESNSGKVAPRGATYAAKLSAVSSPQVSTPPILKKTSRTPQLRSSTSKPNTPKSAKATKVTETSSRECDLNVPVEWYRYNLIDTVDALEYSISRIQKLKKEATTGYLRTRTVEEMRNLHRTLDRILNTSSTRFIEIRDNLNKEMKQYIVKKMGGGSNISDDDDVEILNDLDENDDPIFIDENSMESHTNYNHGNETQEVDLTGVASSEHNDSGEKSIDQNNSIEKDPLANIDKLVNSFTQEPNVENDDTVNCDDDKSIDKIDCDETNGDDVENMIEKDSDQSGEKIQQSKIEGAKIEKVNGDVEQTHNKFDESVEKEVDNINTKDNDEKTSEEIITCDKVQGSEMSDDKSKTDEVSDNKLDDVEMSEDKTQDPEVSKDKTQHAEISEDKTQDAEISDDKTQDAEISEDKTHDAEMSEDKSQDVEMSEEMIETLLKEDNDVENSNCMEDSGKIQET